MSEAKVADTSQEEGDGAKGSENEPVAEAKETTEVTADGSKEEKGVDEIKAGKQKDDDMLDVPPDQYGYAGSKENGMRHGMGKEFNSKGQLKYHGSWNKGKRNGKGVIYNRNGQISYEGELVCGVRHGRGKEYSDSGSLIYEGGFMDGLRHGKKGKLYDEDNDGKLRYVGNFVYGHIYGTGQSFCVNRKGQELTYIGLWSSCRALIPDIILYHGEYLDDAPSGYGVQYEHVEGRKLDENDDKKHDSHLYKGEFLMGRVNLAQGDIVYEGEFKNGVRHGKGFEYPQGKTRYNQGGGEIKDLFIEGTWANGSPLGRPISSQASNGVKVEEGA